MFFKTKICKNKLHIYPEVETHVAKQDPTELIELGLPKRERCILLRNSSPSEQQENAW